MEMKGQASVTDAIYFLLIVTFLSIFLFGFSSNYGKTVKDQINNETETTFATNALKTILYSSTARSQQNSSDKKNEIDYLLAIIKEDYAYDQNINKEEGKVIATTIMSIMSPVQDTKDYMFILHVPPESGRTAKILYIFFHITNFEKESTGYSANNKTHLNYFCTEGNTDFQTKIKKLLRNVGSVSQASAIIRLIDSSTQSTFPAQAEIYLWNAMWLGSTNEISDPLISTSAVPNDCEVVD